MKELPKDQQDFISKFLIDYNENFKDQPKEIGESFIAFGTALIALGAKMVK